MRVAIIDDQGNVAASYPIDETRLPKHLEPGAALAISLEALLPIDWDVVENEV